MPTCLRECLWNIQISNPPQIVLTCLYQSPERRRLRRGLRPVLQQRLRLAQLQRCQRLGLQLVGHLGEDGLAEQGCQDLHRRSGLLDRRHLRLR